MKPKLIFIIGPSCSGKSSMSQAICSLYPEYSVLDDAVPLYKIFTADKLLHQNKLKDFWKFARENSIDMFYDQEDPCFYSHPNNQGGYLIDNPIVWNIVLTILSKQINSDYTIIEFSRGSDPKYNQFFGIKDWDVYPISFNYLCQNVHSSLLKNSLIIDIDSPLEIRKERNLNRYKNGGHLVSEKTMNTVYKEDVFNGPDNVISIKDTKIPIVYIKNQTNYSNPSSFLQNEFIKALICYREYHGKI